MVSVSTALDLLAVGIASLAIVPLRNVARLTVTPSMRRGWQALIAAVMLCMLIVTAKALRELDKPLDAEALAQLVVHLVGATIFATFAGLAHRTALHVMRLARFEVQAFTDGLTGLGNRRLFTERLAEETARARATGTPLCLIVLDIDHFKQVNDTHGHAAGDRVLQHVAGVITAATRNADTVCRIGGEEFVVIMPRIDPAQAATRAEALHGAIGASPVPIADGCAIAATVSLGFAVGQHGETAEALFCRADAALYAAKRGGRDRLSLAA